MAYVTGNVRQTTNSKATKLGSFVLTTKEIRYVFITLCLIVLVLLMKCPSEYGLDKRSVQSLLRRYTLWNADPTGTQNKTLVPRPYDSIADDKARILAAAKLVSGPRNFLLVTFINEAFLPFAYSWMCNTKYMDVHQYLLIIASDRDVLMTLRRNKPEIHSVAIEDFEMKGNLSYPRAGYFRILIKRTNILNWLLQNDVGVFLIEFDCLWIHNPIPEVMNYTNFDLVATIISQRPDKVAGGFCYMFPTQKMKLLWQELCRRLDELDEKLQELDLDTIVSEAENDQSYLNTIIKERYANIRVKRLSSKLFKDGKWYRHPTSRKEMSKYFLINNNFVRGNPAKIDRARRWGHWFTTEDGISCNEKKIENIFYKY